MAKISSYSVNTTPSLNDKLIGTDIDNSNITKNFTISEVLALGGSGVVSLNTLVGALTLVAGTGITITPSGTDITIASTGGGAESINGLSDGTTVGTQNVGLGSGALSLNTGSYNAASGYGALNANTTGSYNSAIGASALFLNTTGQENAALGYVALRENTTGNFNAALGSGALYSNTTGSSNTAIGYQSLNDNISGGSNIGIGKGAGDAITTGSNNTIIGDYAGTTSLSDTVVIAAGTTERLKITETSFSVNGTAGASGSFTASGGEVVEVVNGIITSIG